MAKRNLKQVDIINLAAPYCKKYDIKLNKNDLSQYVNGKVEPGQHKLYILGLALNVNEAWLMGFDDVPMERIEDKERSASEENTQRVKLINNYDSLDDNGKTKLYEYSCDLIDSGKYKNTVLSITAARSADNSQSIKIKKLPDLSQYPADDTDF